MLKNILLGILTLGVYPLIKKGRKTSFSKNTKKYYKDGTLRKEVDIDFTTDEKDTDVTDVINSGLYD